MTNTLDSPPTNAVDFLLSLITPLRPLEPCASVLPFFFKKLVGNPKNPVPIPFEFVFEFVLALVLVLVVVFVARLGNRKAPICLLPTNLLFAIDCIFVVQDSCYLGVVVGILYST